MKRSFISVMYPFVSSCLVVKTSFTLIVRFTVRWIMCHEVDRGSGTSHAISLLFAMVYLLRRWEQ